MALSDVNFQRTQGAGLQPPGEDHISGFVYYKNVLPDFRDVNEWADSTEYEEGDLVRYEGKVYEANEGHISSADFATDENKWTERTDTKFRAKRYLTLAAAEDDGITQGDVNFGVLWYHMKEFWRLQEDLFGRRGELYVMIGNIPDNGYDFSEIKKLQDFADGKIRQVAIYIEDAFNAEHITTIQGIADTVFNEHKPLNALYAGDLSGTTDWGQLDNLSELAVECTSVSAIIGQDGDGEGATLYDDTGTSVTVIGAALGALSSANVHESIAWVGKFPVSDGSELMVPALANGDLISETDTAVQVDIENKRYIFLRKHVGKENTYFSQSHASTPLTNQFSHIEFERAFYKATRLVRQYLLDELNGPVFVDANTGQLSEDYVAYIEGLGDQALEQMERDGELSGAQTIVDPEQNVNETGNVKVTIEKVKTGVSRTFLVEAGYVQQLS